MNLYTLFIRPLLFLLPPERAHHFTFILLRLFDKISPNDFRLYSAKRDPINLLGLDFPHRVGLAAGLDKDGKAFRAFGKMGFAFVEVGTVTPIAQSGNPKPRLFRLLADQALINRMGFNNKGVEALKGQLQKKRGPQLLGGNIGKNTLTPNDSAAEDYLLCFKQLYDWVDYFVVNVSCPNIQDLRELQDKDSLTKILQSLMEERAKHQVKKPILLKVSPDLNNDQLDDLMQVISETGIHGIVATNTTVTRDTLSTSAIKVGEIGRGGLSGRPLRNRSTAVIQFFRTKMGPSFPIIASGGIMSSQDAQEKIEAGADLIQIYTGFIYRGPRLIAEIMEL